mmetsp:Transcript_125219/g.401136  ORF Transcript_125219/g.401136 Transcript_125219/m.401136 type:complete len:210 (-) Transcript_125219:1671-2300(-)
MVASCALGTDELWASICGAATDGRSSSSSPSNPKIDAHRLSSPPFSSDSSPSTIPDGASYNSASGLNSSSIWLQAMLRVSCTTCGSSTASSEDDSPIVKLPDESEPSLLELSSESVCWSSSVCKHCDCCGCCTPAAIVLRPLPLLPPAEACMSVFFCAASLAPTCWRSKAKNACVAELGGSLALSGLLGDVDAQVCAEAPIDALATLLP